MMIKKYSCWADSSDRLLYGVVTISYLLRLLCPNLQSLICFQVDVLRLLPALPRALPLARRQPQGLQVHRREHRLQGTYRYINVMF